MAKKQKLAKSPAPFKAKINVDLSGWDLGEWPGKLTDLVEVDVSDGTVTIEIKPGPAFDRAAQFIAEDAIKAFFEEEMFFHVEGEGICIMNAACDRKQLIPWHHLMFGDPLVCAVAALNWIEAELDESSPQDSDEEKVAMLLKGVREQIGKA